MAKKPKGPRPDLRVRMLTNNPMWLGENAGYMAIHKWIRYRKPRPDTCPKCNRRVRVELSNISGDYKRDVNDWQYLCRSCHMKFDYENEMRSGLRHVERLFIHGKNIRIHDNN